MSNEWISWPDAGDDGTDEHDDLLETATVFPGTDFLQELAQVHETDWDVDSDALWGDSGDSGSPAIVDDAPGEPDLPM